MDVLKVITSTAFLFSIIRVTTPLLYGSLSSLMSELSGVSNIGIEGMMLTCALTGVLSSAFFGGNAWIGLLAAMLVCLLFGAAEALAVNPTIQNMGVPTELVSTIPYIVTIIVLVIYSCKKIRDRKKVAAA